MKFIHLSDLHIGKRVYEFSMIEDQKYILEQIIKIIEKEKPDGVIVAGDLYDKPIPPAEAVSVLDDFFTKLADRNCKLFVISGNHDSPERIAFGAKLMNDKGVYVSPVYGKQIEPIVMEDSFGEICIYLLPFLKPAIVRRFYEEEEINSYQDTLRVVISHMEVSEEKRNLLVAHQFVTGAMRCESEEITVGGLDQVDVSLFEAFDYVALGHIHSPQHVGREEVRYCGTPLKYSFSETEQKKSVTVVEMKEKGNVTIRTIPLNPLRDFHVLRGTYEEVTNRSFYQDLNMQDYMQIILTDEEDIMDGLQKLRIIYPNLMCLEYDNKRTRKNHFIEGIENVEKKSEIELFEEFFALQNNQEMTEKQKIFLKKIMEDVKDKS